MKYETSEFVYESVEDDGPDLVVQVTDIESGESWTERIDSETASFFEGRPYADFIDSVL